ncbi:hypothetical protein [Leptospira santarosai]|nr:hypothetical protein [Leptospira santarosai]AVV77821.1 Uncharacterized protein XB15_00015 [Leptospira santarosai]
MRSEEQDNAQTLENKNRTKRIRLQECFSKNKGTSSFSCETKKASGRIC